MRLYKSCIRISLQLITILQYKFRNVWSKNGFYCSVLQVFWLIFSEIQPFNFAQSLNYLYKISTKTGQLSICYLNIFKIFMHQSYLFVIDDLTTAIALELPLNADWQPELDTDEDYAERVKTDIELEVLLGAKYYNYYFQSTNI